VLTEYVHRHSRLPEAGFRACSAPGKSGPVLIEPRQICLVTATVLPFPLEQLVGLGQHQSVGPTTAARLMGHREFGRLDTAVDVGTTVLGERPLERLSGRVVKERLQPGAEFAATILRQLDRPVVAGAGGAGQAGFQGTRGAGHGPALSAPR